MINCRTLEAVYFLRWGMQSFYKPLVWVFQNLSGMFDSTRAAELVALCSSFLPGEMVPFSDSSTYIMCLWLLRSHLKCFRVLQSMQYHSTTIHLSCCAVPEGVCWHPASFPSVLSALQMSSWGCLGLPILSRLSFEWCSKGHCVFTWTARPLQLTSLRYSEKSCPQYYFTVMNFWKLTTMRWILCFGDRTPITVICLWLRISNSFDF